jgi:hypothetical protein
LFHWSLSLQTGRLRNSRKHLSVFLENILPYFVFVALHSATSIVIWLRLPGKMLFLFHWNVLVALAYAFDVYRGFLLHITSAV